MRGFNCVIFIIFFTFSLTVWEVDAGWKLDYLPMNFTLEEEYSGVFPYTLTQLDMEKGSLLGCSVSGPGVTEEPVGIFHIDKNRAVIQVNQKVDYEQHQNFMIRMDCISSDKVQTRLGVEIQVIDINDNAPEFDKEKYQISVEESTPQGSELVSVSAVDLDDSSSGNGLFSFSIISVTPPPPPSSLQFFITQQNNSGLVSFRGCLDYEEAQSYTIVVEAKDHGKSVQLSSSATVIINIIDNNDHRPQLSVRPGGGRVREGESGVVVYRLEVSDGDQRGSAGWRAKYSLHGEKHQNFRIETEPTTNRGILSVTTPLDVKEGSELDLMVSVENEEPLVSCTVKRRRDGGLWDVDYFRQSSGTALLSFPVTVTVETANDPPELNHPEKHVSTLENTAPGYNLWTFTPTAQDLNSPGNIRDAPITSSGRTGTRPTARISIIALTIIITSLLLGVLLAAFSFSCVKRRVMMKDLQGSEGSLLHYNTETPGTDCENFPYIIIQEHQHRNWSSYSL